MKTEREPVGGTRLTLQTAIGVLIGIGVLYLGREVLIPIALAILLSFFLSPPMIRLQRWGFGKTLSALMVVAVSFLLLTSICWVGLGQVYNLSLDLPAYRDNIGAKLRSLTPPGLKRLEDTQRLFTDIGGTLAQPSQPKPPPSQRPIPVEVREPAPEPLGFLTKTAGSLLGPLATAAIVFVFLIFILLGREDLRDRMLRLAGSNRLYTTTQALDDAARRVSQYLLMQLVVNASYGVLVGLGLLLIGIPHPLVWGVLAAVLRFVPYVGPWIAAAGPLLLAVGVAPGWGKFAWTLGLYVFLEIATANAVEPLLYGSSTGISPIAILVAAVFWTWLWGPIGLLLSTPLTVCVVVIGRYVPHLEFLGILFGDEPALSPSQRFYQRMIAMDAEDAADLTEQLLKDRELVDVYDSVIIPTLSLLEEGRHAGFLEAATENCVLENTRELVDDLRTRNIQQHENELRKLLKVICLPAKDAADDLASHMFAQLLSDFDVHEIPLDVSGDELVRAVSSARPDLICISGVPPHATRNVALRCRHLRRVCPDIPILAAVWSSADLTTIREKIPLNDANHVACTLRQAVEYVREVANIPASPPSTETSEAPVQITEDATEQIATDTADQIAELELLGNADGNLLEVLDGILQSAANAFNVPMGILKLKQSNGKIWKAECGVPPDLAPAMESFERLIDGLSPRDGTQLVIEDIAKDSRFASSKLGENGVHFCACQRLRDRNQQIIGLLVVLDTRTRLITTQEEELLRATAAAAVEAQEVRTVGPRPEIQAFDGTAAAVKVPD
jgi:predicted PurR-regulated permease PerM